MTLTDFDFELPPERIAQSPTSPRDHCRLLVLEKDTPPRHQHFYDLLDILKEGDVVVINNSKVIPARLFATKPTGGKVEIFLVRELSEGIWTAMIKNLKATDRPTPLAITDEWHATPEEKLDDILWKISFDQKGPTLANLIREHGSEPTPPYITRPAQKGEYETVYASQEGSVAAPTAGFHFTEKLINDLKNKGVIFAEVTLHVGPGTFAPIRVDDFTTHRMHGELATISPETARTINLAKSEQRRVIAVGTTSTRTLEAFADSDGTLHPGTKDVDLFIYPGFPFKIIDGLITNFHLPQSTLLLLVCAFAECKKSGGKERILAAYQEAIEKEYMFYSFGDAMIIL